MIMKRITALILAALMLTALNLALSAPALAAPGDAGDPLISKSYADGQLRGALLTQGHTIIGLAVDRLLTKYASLLNGGSLSTGSFTQDELPAGEKVNLTLGGSVVLITGSARLDISYGTVINVTTGRAVDSGGELVRGNRYLAAENTYAVVTMTVAGLAALDGDALRGEPRATFSDVPHTHWAFSYVELLAGMGAVSGIGGGQFNPDGEMTRADFVTILGRLAGVDTAAQDTGYSDVPSGQYYAPYVKWASDNDIVTGYGDGRFGPTDKIQRSQMALIVVRYAKYAGIALESGGSGEKFADDASIPAWAKSEVYIARDSKLIDGVGGNMFSPSGGATRAQVCAILARLLTR